MPLGLRDTGVGLTPDRVARHLHVALGWHPLERHGATWLWHNGGTGGFRSFIVVDPRAHTSVCVLANTARSVDRLGMTLLEHIGATQ